LTIDYTYGGDDVYKFGDTDKNKIIDGVDLAALSQNWAPLGYTGGGVPDPATLCLLALGGLAMLRRGPSDVNSSLPVTPPPTCGAEITGSFTNA
jgi:hypothetical protein